MWIATLTAAALAGPTGTDLAVSTVGADVGVAPVEGGSDLDLIAAQRLRWRLIDGDDFALQARVNGRFSLDLDEAPLLERRRVRELGIKLGNDSFTVDAGRAPVHRGGPRLVDGVQALVHPSKSLDIGLWGGLAPDLFTTDPRLRPGGGPVFALTRSRLQASVVGEALLFEGELDRAGVLTMVRAATDRLFDLSGRLDLELAGENGPHLTDGQLFGMWRPADLTRVDVFYDAFSSYKYLRSEAVQPELQRFQQRLADLGVQYDINQDTYDPTIHHLFGASARWQLQSDGVAPKAAVFARSRTSPNPVDRYAKLNPQIGLVSIPLGGLLDVTLDANAVAIDQALQGDGGLILVWLPDEDGAVEFDASVRALVNPEDYDGLGWYADLYVDLVVDGADVVLVSGISALREPDPLFGIVEPSYGAFVRLSRYFRPARRASRSASGS